MQELFGDSGATPHVACNCTVHGLQVSAQRGMEVAMVLGESFTVRRLGGFRASMLGLRRASGAAAAMA